MNPYQVMGIIACCTAIFAGVVAVLTIQGVPVVLAFLGVYLVAVWVMLGMQRRARQLFDGTEHPYQRRLDQDTVTRTVRVNFGARAKAK